MASKKGGGGVAWHRGEMVKSIIGGEGKHLTAEGEKQKSENEMRGKANSVKITKYSTRRRRNVKIL